MRNVKRICFLCPWMNTDGGLQRVVSGIANKLAEDNKYEISLCIVSKEIKKTYYPLNVKIKVDYLIDAAKGKRNFFQKVMSKVLNNFNLSFISDKFKKYIYFSKKRVEILDNYLIQEQFDYVIAACGEMSLFLSCVDRNKISSKLFGWQHNSYEAYFKKRGEYYYGFERLASKLYRNLDEIIVLTEQDKNKYMKNMQIKCKNIYNPLSFKCDEKTKISNKSLIFVGRLVWKQKGLDYLVDILRKVFSDDKAKDWNIIIVGDGTDKKRLIEGIKKNNIEHKVKMVGKKENVLEYYLKASILLNTSRWEGFGLVITEAMECGLPVVAFATDGPNEIITHNENGYIVPMYDTDEFAKYILKLIQKVEERKRMSNNAIERAQVFNESKILEEWKRLLD